MTVASHCKSSSEYNNFRLRNKLYNSGIEYISILWGGTGRWACQNIEIDVNTKKDKAPHLLLHRFNLAQKSLKATWTQKKF